MAYQPQQPPPPQPPQDRRGPMDHPHDLPRHSWSPYPPPPPPPPQNHAPYHHQPPFAQAPPVSYSPPDEMDIERSDSDVSTTGPYHYGRSDSPAVPASLQPSKHGLDSSDAINARLRELSQVEDHNIRKQEALAAKRQRMDERINRKRAIQDAKLQALHDARRRRDSKISARRARENAAFKAVDDQLEEEETNLRRRLKRLKRGLPPDESPKTGRSISTSSMSPPGPAYSTIPPPPKRHQSIPPGHNEGQQNHHPPPSQPPNVPPAPSYSFYQGNQKPYTVPYHAGPTYSTVPPNAPPMMAGGPPPSSSMDRPSYGMNGRPSSPGPRPSLSTVPPMQGTPPALSSSRQTSSTYDTRPPPTTSGFASINAPTSTPASTGFATINSRAAATPPTSNSSLAKPYDAESSRTPAGSYSDQPPASSGKANGNSNNSTPATGKRTPSTTHPYQMSEAFANRHHHCERVDGLNRGIWTSYGLGGTQDVPTGPPVEMYLRCNHDNCRRIDWRTVHGLQCHIVKNHEQPKGTIGSLEKALDRYGVPIAEVEAYERDHGEGAGGTMADPKNLKIKNKTKAAYTPGQQGTPGSYGVDPTARPAGYRPSPTGSSADSPIVSSAGGGQHSGMPPRGYSHEDVHSAERSNHVQAEQPRQRYEPVKNEWHVINSGTPTRSPIDASKELQGDAVMRDAPASQPPAPAPIHHQTPVSAYHYSPHQQQQQPQPPPPTYMPSKQSTGSWKAWGPPPPASPNPTTNANSNSRPPSSYQSHTRTDSASDPAPAGSEKPVASSERTHSSTPKWSTSPKSAPYRDGRGIGWATTTSVQSQAETGEPQQQDKKATAEEKREGDKVDGLKGGEESSTQADTDGSGGIGDVDTGRTDTEHRMMGLAEESLKAVERQEGKTSTLMTPEDGAVANKTGGESEITAQGDKDAMDVDVTNANDKHETAPPSAADTTISAAQDQHHGDTPPHTNGDGHQSSKDSDPSTAKPTAVGPPASSTRSALQSPIVTNKTLNPPRSSGKKTSSGRRSSAARTAEGEGHNAGTWDDEDGENDRDRAREKEEGDNADADDTENTEQKDEDGNDGTGRSGGGNDKEHGITRGGLRNSTGGASTAGGEAVARTPPRRNATGRFTRRRTGAY